MSDQKSVLHMLTSVTTAGKHTSLANFVHQNPQLAGDMARMTAGKNPPVFDGKGQRTITRPNSSDLKQISSKIAEADDNAQAVMHLFSDVKIASEILISSIRSPNDMYEGEVLFDLKDNLHTTPLAGRLMPLVRSYFKDVYPLADKFEDVLRGTLFGAGSYPILVLPENSLTDLIRGESAISTENAAELAVAPDGYFKGLGLLGDPDQAATAKLAHSLEGLYTRKSQSTGNRCVSVKSADGHTITCNDLIFLDNPITVQMPLVNQIARESRVSSMRSSLSKNATKLTDRDLAQTLYRKASSRMNDFVKVKTDAEIKRYPVGRPLILDLPPESVAPVINRGRPDDPVGYIVILDSDGAPLSKSTEVSQFEALKRAKGQGTGLGGAGGDMSSYLLQRTASAFGTTCEEATLRQVSQIFGEILDADFGARVRSSYGNEVVIANSSRLAELMLHRVFSAQKTQLLFVPESMLTYFSYQVNDNGTGRNLLQDSLVISSMRAQVLFARVMSAVKNSVGRTKVDIQLDPDTQDSQEVFDIIKGEVINARQIGTVPNSVNPVDILNQIQAQGIEFQVTGGKGMPETKVEFSETSTNYVRPDEDLSTELADLMINHIGVPPEMVEDARRPEFATVAIASNILFSKRVRHMQQRYHPQITHLVVGMLMADSTFIIELKKLITENLTVVTENKNLHEDLAALKDTPVALVDLLCSEFISGIKATLTRPDLKSIENNLEALNKHEEMIDKALEHIFSQESADATMIGEEASSKIEAVKKAAKSAIMRRFMQENNMAPEAFELVTKSEEGSLAWDLRGEIEQHVTTVTDVLLGILNKTSRIAAASDAEHGKLIPTADATPSFDSSSDTGGGDEGGMDSGGGGGDDMSLDDFPLS